jgi:hypothetical protein
VSLDDQLRTVLNEQADMPTAPRPDVQGLISGGQARRRRRNAVRAGGGVLAAAIAVGGVYGLVQVGGGNADSVGQIADQLVPQRLPDAPEPVALEPGTYVVQARSDVVAPYTITVPAGWVAQHGVNVGKDDDQRVQVRIEPFVLEQIRLTVDTCHGDETLGAPQTSTASLVAGLRAQGSGLRVSDPVADTVSGLAATRIDLDYPGTEPLSNCRLSTTPGVEPGALQVGSGYFVMFPAETASVYVVDAGGRAQVFVTRTADDASAADVAELESVIDSIRIQTGAE